MKEEQNLNKIAKYLSDNSDSAEREELFAWIKEKPANKTLLEDSMEVWEVAEASDLEFQPNLDAAWAKMDERLMEARGNETSEAIVRPLSFFRPWMRIAAAVVLLAGIALWQYTRLGSQDFVETQTIAQEKTTIDLPDGSKVWLNQNSSLKYKKVFDNRVVHLEGEAFFDVEKVNGKSFEIYAGDSKIAVLGTSFNVRAYPDENKVELAVETGRVEFSSEEKPIEKEQFTAGEFGTYTKSSHEIDKLDLAKLNATAWKKGALRFKNSGLTDVVESLERYYDIDIKVNNSKIYNCIWINTQTYEQPVLEDLLEIIGYVNSVEIEKTGQNSFTFSGEGCDKKK